eukprot:2718510-Pleurochrysis_carterae.AAC.2
MSGSPSSERESASSPCARARSASPTVAESDAPPSANARVAVVPNARAFGVHAPLRAVWPVAHGLHGRERRMCMTQGKTEAEHARGAVVWETCSN